MIPKRYNTYGLFRLVCPLQAVIVCEFQWCSSRGSSPLWGGTVTVVHDRSSTALILFYLIDWEGRGSLPVKFVSVLHDREITFLHGYQRVLFTSADCKCQGKCDVVKIEYEDLDTRLCFVTHSIPWAPIGPKNQGFYKFMACLYWVQVYLKLYFMTDSNCSK